MKLISEYSYYDNEREKNITTRTYDIGESGAEYYSNIDFLYNCKYYPENYEYTKDWLQYNFNCDTVEEATKTIEPKEYQILQDYGFINTINYCGECYEYTCTFINDRIVSIVEEKYYDI